MRYMKYILCLVLIVLLSSCAEKHEVETDAKETALIEQESKSGVVQLPDDKSEKFLKDFPSEYPDYEILDYVEGKEENYPIDLVAVAENQKTGSSSTLFIVDSNGVTQKLGLAGDYISEYRKEDGLKLNKNIISLSLDVKASENKEEIHDFNITVTENDDKGVTGINFTNDETVRKK